MQSGKRASEQATPGGEEGQASKACRGDESTAARAHSWHRGARMGELAMMSEEIQVKEQMEKELEFNCSMPRTTMLMAVDLMRTAT